MVTGIEMFLNNLRLKNAKNHHTLHGLVGWGGVGVLGYGYNLRLCCVGVLAISLLDIGILTPLASFYKVNSWKTRYCWLETLDKADDGIVTVESESCDVD